MSNRFDDDFDDGLDDDAPSHTSVTMKLAIIQKRCSELLGESDDDALGGLSLEDDDAESDDGGDPKAYDPYGRS